jgi:L-malate glycosyltransferase
LEVINLNILYLINHAGKGGTEKYIKNLILNFQSDNNIFFAYNEYGQLCDEIKELKIPTVQIKMSSPFDLKAAKKLALFCKQNNIQLVHTQFQREAYVCAIAKFFYNKFKLVYTCHINIENNLPRKLTNSLLSRKYDAIISVSTVGSDILISNKMQKNKIEVIFNGADYNEHEFDSSTPYIKDEFNIAHDTFVFSSLTRFSIEKGNLFLLKCINSLKDKTNKKFVVLLVGDGELINECKKYVQDNNLKDFVIFMGYRKDSLEILKETNVFLNSSSNEALSFALLEALSQSLPLIVTNVGGNTDIVNDNTKCGIIVNYGDIQHYSDAMKTLAEDTLLCKQYSNNSNLAIKNIFSLKQSLNKTHNVYERLINNVNR